MSYDAWKTTEPECYVYDGPDDYEEPPVCDCCGADFVHAWLGLPGGRETRGACESCGVLLAMSLPDDRGDERKCAK